MTDQRHSTIRWKSTQKKNVTGNDRAALFAAPAEVHPDKGTSADPLPRDNGSLKSRTCLSSEAYESSHFFTERQVPAA